MNRDIQRLIWKDEIIGSRTSSILKGFIRPPLNRIEIPRLDQIKETFQHKKRSHAVLDSLFFQEMENRSRQVHVAHRKTFDWVFDREERHQFSRWLKSGSSVYWIHGKAGSGKSTLMCFIAEHPTTIELLKEWAGEKSQLIIVPHYFWHAGQGLQRSRVGLLRAILYRILKESPDLVAPMCEKDGYDPDPFRDWTEAELFDALRTISQPESNLRFCFFIDALDEYTDCTEEYEGAFGKLIELIYDLSESPLIKVCTSSRPWSQFNEAFDSTHFKLRLENFTKPAISLYVNDKLQLHRRFSQLSSEDPRCRRLCDTIVEKAQGVFLWVSLVVSSLLQGIEKGDQFRLLQARLNSFPPALEDYFRHMIGNIEPIYREESARIFSISLHKRQDLPLIAYGFFNPDEDQYQAALEMTRDSALEMDLERTLIQMKEYLNARAMDLLDITYDEGETEVLLRNKVTFLHRTVADFFRKPGALATLFGSTNTSSFDPCLALSTALLRLIKVYVARSPTLKADVIFGYADELMSHAWDIEQASDSGSALQQARLAVSFKVLEELDRFNNLHYWHSYSHRAAGHWTCKRESPRGQFQEHAQKIFLATAIQFGLRQYTKRKIEEDPDQLTGKRGRPILDYALRPVVKTSLALGPVAPNETTVKMLLEAGADPNQVVHIYPGQMTVWELYIRLCHAHFQSEQRESSDRQRAYNIMMTMLSSGARPDVYLWTGSETSVTILDAIEALSLPDSLNDELLRLLEQKTRERSWSEWWVTRWLPLG